MYEDDLGSRISMKRQPNTFVITTKSDQLITVTTG